MNAKRSRQNLKTLTINEEVHAVLRGAAGLVEVRDSQGRLLGFFAPSDVEHASSYVQAAARIDPQEIRRRAALGGPTYSYAEVMAHLRSLGEPRCVTP